MTALVIGRDFAVLKLARAQLADRYKVLFATDTESAIDMARLRQPDAVLIHALHGSGIFLTMVTFMRAWLPDAAILVLNTRREKNLDSLMRKVVAKGGCGVVGLPDDGHLIGAIVDRALVDNSEVQHG